MTISKIQDIEAIKNKPLPARKMHELVWVLVAVFTAIAASFPIAMLRVSKEAKFHGSHVISLSDAGELTSKK
jgi:hypothetical protein